MKRYILALDQGTTSSRAILFDREQTLVQVAQREFTQHYPKPGWVEHDAEEILSIQLQVAREALEKAGAAAGDIAAIGITNQRETVVVWDKKTGAPICPAIVWQCRRTAESCDVLRAKGLEPLFREKTGLLLDAYFSGTKLHWVLENVPGARARAEAGELLFGSEIKSLLEHPGFRREVNAEALRPYLTFQYSAMNETFFKGTYKLPPAHWFTYRDGKMQIERYWDVDFRHPTALSYEAAADEIDARVRESVAAHRISDVKLGAFLSGGVDSSYITACLMPDETFSVGFASPDGTHKFDETTEAGELSQKLGIKNYREMLTKEQCLDAFADIQYHMDEPQSNPSSVPLYFLCQLARQHVTVVLSGEGADEIYAGYEWYADTPLMQKYKHIPAPLRHLASDVSQQLPYFKGHDFIIKGSGRPEDWFIGQAHVFEEKDAYDILKPKYRVGPTAREVAAPIYDRVKDLSELEKKQYLDLNLWLPGDILLKADKMSMAHSLELRVPYLDREVLREAECYPDSYKLRGDTKAVLRTAANKTLPDAWANRTKKGFPVPIAKWFEDPEFSAKVRKSFTSDVAAEYFDQDKLVAMLADPKHERRKIWTAYTFLTWHEQFFEKFDA